MTAVAQPQAALTAASLVGCLSLADVTPLAKSLARRTARVDSDEDDLVQVALFSYHEATTQTYVNAAPMENPHAFARTVLHRAMQRYYARPLATDDACDLDDAGALDGTSARQADLLDFDDYFAALERTHGPTARAVAENLLAPSGKCAGHILAAATERAAVRANLSATQRRHGPRGCTRRVRLSADNVRRGLGLSPTVWHKTLAAVRTFTRTWLAADGALVFE